MLTLKLSWLALLAPVLAFSCPARADDACDGMGWSVEKERGWFSDAKLPHRVTGARLRRIDRAVQLDLQPTSKVKFFLPPETTPKSDSYSGEVTFFGVPKPGFYQVTLSDPATIDVFENGVRLKSMADASAKDCPGIARSVRFKLAPGDLVLVEVSSAAEKSIKVAFTEAP